MGRKRKRKPSALQFEFVHPRAGKTSEICTAPPVLIPSVPNLQTFQSLSVKFSRTTQGPGRKFLPNSLLRSQKLMSETRRSSGFASDYQQPTNSCAFIGRRLIRGNTERPATNGESRNCFVLLLPSNRRIPTRLLKFPRNLNFAPTWFLGVLPRKSLSICKSIAHMSAPAASKPASTFLKRAMNLAIPHLSGEPAVVPHEPFWSTRW